MIPCATPVVKGFNTPVENPHPTAAMDMPKPTNSSQPIASAKATARGTMGMHSSKLPIKAPILKKNKVTTARSKYFLSPVKCTIFRNI